MNWRPIDVEVSTKGSVTLVNVQPAASRTERVVEVARRSTESVLAIDQHLAGAGGVEQELEGGCCFGATPCMQANSFHCWSAVPRAVLAVSGLCLMRPARRARTRAARPLGRMAAAAIDPRQFRADSILANAGQWLRIRSKDGRPLAFGVPSTRDPSRVYLVRPNACTCQDAARGHRCKHQRAVAIYCQQLRRQREEVVAQTEPYAF
jgi:hypothetical protein